MKRFRDELYANPQFRRPLSSSSRGESYRPSHLPPGGGGGVSGGSGGGGGGGGRGEGGSGGGGEIGGADVVAGSTQKLTTKDALSYLKQVKDMFQNQREKYDSFLDVMKDFKAQRIGTSGVTARVKELFKGHPNLILGFNMFLPKGYEITLTEEDEAPAKRTVEFDEAITFVNKIKNRFKTDDHVYKSFLDILNMYRKEHKGITEVYQEVAALFDDHPDLLDEFTRFLPDTSASVSAPHTSFVRHSIARHDERSSVFPTIRPSHIEKVRPRKDIKVEPSGEQDIDGDKAAGKLLKEQKKHMEKENRDKRNPEADNRDHEFENNGDINVHRHSDKRKSARKVENFGGNSGLASYDDKDALKSMYSYEFTFCEKVKERLQSADDYQAFLKCLHIYSTEIITRKELQSLIADLLGKYPDLMDGFNEFLERCERIDGFLAGVMGKKSLWNDGNSSKPLRIHEKEKEQKREVESGKEKDRYNMKYWGKSIQELDLSSSQRCTPSYRFLPDDYPISTASQRSDLGDEVLNDRWVSVTSGSEDYSFKHMRRNQFEESLFRCEDDRFELDLLLESVNSSAKRVEELLNSINSNAISSDGPLRIEDHFTALNIRCIERIYGDHGLDVIDILKKNPSIALHVILTRLKQKQEEWTKCRSDFNNVWAEIYAKNHYKSLDHRSFYFKQQDSKNLSTKSLVTEIRMMKEQNQNEDDLLLSIAAGGSKRHSMTPNMVFEYADDEVHEDVYKIIKYSCEELCSSKEQMNKILKFWATFLEPMLGINSRLRASENAEEYDVSKHCNVKPTAKTESDSSLNDDGNRPNIKHSKSLTGNGDSNTSPQHGNLTRTGFMKVDVSANDGPEPDVVNGEGMTKSDLAVLGQDANYGHGANSSRVNNSLILEGNEAKSATDDMVSSVCGVDATGSKQSFTAKFPRISKLLGLKEDFDDPCKNEKEEGELSPNGDFEDNFGSASHSNEAMEAEIGSHDEICADRAGENDAEADDENSENLSDAAEDVSGSESAADECSREEHEEDGEHDELDGKAESEGEAENISESLPQSERFLLTCKPLSKYMDSSSSAADDKKVLRVFYGNDTFYVLFRLHQCLYERILSAKTSLADGESKWRTTKDADLDPYDRFMSALFSLLDGSSDNAKFEDDCRSLIGNNSYMLFTLDKLIYKLVKQLQTVSTEEVECKLLHLYEYESSRNPEKYVDSVYYENVHVLLHDENIYRLECKTSSTTCLSIRLMDDGNEKSEVVAVSIDPNFSNYLHKDFLSVDQGKKLSAVKLKRNVKKYLNLDESKAMCMATENALIMNGLECKMETASSKISYVLDSEDFFIRLPRRCKTPEKYLAEEHARVQKFHQFLAATTA